MEARTNEESSLPPIAASLGGALRQLRVARNLTQSELARRSKVKRSNISGYEADKTVPDASTLARLLRALGFTWGAIDRAKVFLRGLGADEITAGSCTGADREALLRAAEEEVAEVSARAAELLRSTSRVSDLLGHLRESSIAAAEENKERDRAIAGTLLIELRSLPRKVQIQRIKSEGRFGNWALCDLLCLGSRQAASRDLAYAARLADLAVLVADMVRDEALRNKLLGLAYGHAGNVLRIKGEFRVASRTFRKAREHWEAGGSSHPGYVEEGLLDALEASLRRDEGDFPEALALLACAAANATGKRLRVEVAVSRAKLYHEMGDLERAVLLLEEIREDDLPTNDDRLLLCVRHNRADYLSKLERFEEAKALLPSVRALSRKTGGELDHARLAWIEARVAAGLGNLDEGVEMLTKVRAVFARHRMDFDTALVSLELASYYAKAGKVEEVKTLARHMVPIFQSKAVHKEALAALLLFRQVAEQGRATEGLVRSILLYLRSARYRPGLRFEGQAG